jgi:Holliday junction resolvasome RuvABC endonuclease subunit
MWCALMEQNTPISPVSPSHDLLVVAIDPGTGVSSPTGLAVFDPYTREILLVANLGSKKKTSQGRIKDITKQLAAELAPFASTTLVCFVEYFVMRGKGGETLQRMVGGYIAVLPEEMELEEVQNSTVKKTLAGHGAADKRSVAMGVRDWFYGNKTSSDMINILTSRYEEDIIDALAIGITGWQKRQAKSSPRSKSQK